ncbi:hypothetical protein, partial [Streptomyces antarcticus]|uniref:hypothetical protein n=1 Tax=Streptomyces antarcticus TaxID=2996458 RepID=UPI0022B07664
MAAIVRVDDIDGAVPRLHPARSTAPTHPMRTIRRAPAAPVRAPPTECRRTGWTVVRTGWLGARTTAPVRTHVVRWCGR